MWTVLGTIGIVLATIVLGLLADKKWGLLPSAKKLREASAPKQLPAHAPGGAPSTALSAPPKALRCPRCKAAMERTREEIVTYDGRALRVLAFCCPRCAHTGSVYVEASGHA